MKLTAWLATGCDSLLASGPAVRDSRARVVSEGLHLLHGLQAVRASGSRMSSTAVDNEWERKEARGNEPGGGGEASPSTDGGRSQESGKKKKIRAADWITEKGAVSGAKISGSFNKSSMAERAACARLVSARRRRTTRCGPWNRDTEKASGTLATLHDRF